MEQRSHKNGCKCCWRRRRLWIFKPKSAGEAVSYTNKIGKEMKGNNWQNAKPSFVNAMHDGEERMRCWEIFVSEHSIKEKAREC